MTVWQSSIAIDVWVLSLICRILFRILGYLLNDITIRYNCMAVATVNGLVSMLIWKSRLPELCIFGLSSMQLSYRKINPLMYKEGHP